MRALLATTVAMAFLFCPASEAAAQDMSAREEARALFERGREAQSENDLASARTLFLRSLELEPRAATAFNLAVVCGALGRVAEAHEHYEDLLTGEYGELREQQRAQVEDLAREVAERIARVRLVVTGASDVVLSIDDEEAESEPLTDGVPRALVLDPGSHVLALRAEGRPPERRELELDEGETRELRVEFAATGPTTGGGGGRDDSEGEVAEEGGGLTWLWVTLAVVAAGAIGVGVFFAVDGASGGGRLEDDVFGVTETLSFGF